MTGCSDPNLWREGGERTGGIPYGYRAVGGMLVEEPREQATVALARKLRGEGKSLRKIVTALVEAGHAPRAGKKWHAQVVKRLVGV